MITLGNRETPWSPGMTVADIVKDLGRADIGFLVDVDGKVVLQKDWGTTAIPDGARVRVRPLMGGG